MKNSIVLVLVTALAVAGIAAGDANVSVACDSGKTATAKAGSGDCCAAQAAVASAADCEKACAEVAAAVTAGKKDCCKAAVAAAMKASYSTADASGCTRNKTAGSGGCDKSANATAGTTGGCSKSATATASLNDCCKETLTAFHAAMKKSMAAHAGVVWASSSCARGANAVAGMGCDKSKSAAAVAGAGKSGCGSSAAALSYAEVNAREGKQIVLTGNPACAKCTFHSADACEALFQTKDGKIYRVLKNNHYAEMRDADAENGFKVTTRVRKLDGVTYLEIETLKAL